MELTYKAYYNIDDVKNVWSELAKSQSDLSPFQEYDFVRCLAKRYWPYWFLKRSILVYVVFYEYNNPVLLLPLEKNVTSSSVQLLADIHGCNYCDILYKEAKYLLPCLSLYLETHKLLTLEKVRCNTRTYMTLADGGFTDKARFTECVKIMFSKLPPH